MDLACYDTFLKKLEEMRLAIMVVNFSTLQTILQKAIPYPLKTAKELMKKK